MAKSKETYNKKEKEKARQKKKQNKEMRREQRKSDSPEKRSFEDMIAYVDEDGNITSTPPDPTKKRKVSLEDIEIGVPKRMEEQVEVIRKGKINYFDEDKGYGFIIDETTRDSIFVHVNGLIDSVQVNDKVTFEVERSAKGLRAFNVQLLR